MTGLLPRYKASAPARPIKGIRAARGSAAALAAFSHVRSGAARFASECGRRVLRHLFTCSP